MAKVVIPFVVLFAVIAWVFTLTPPEKPADLTFINRGEVHTLDPQRMSWLQDFRINDAIFEGLVSYNNYTMEIDPGVARSWTISPDGQTYTFHLRKDAKWSNGKPVTSQDFIYAWRRALLPDLAADYGALFWKIRGGRSFFDWRTEQIKDLTRKLSAAQSYEEREMICESGWQEVEQIFPTMVGIEAPDDHTLVVQLEQPTPYMLDLFAFGSFRPVYAPSVDPYVQFNLRTGGIQQLYGWTKPGKLISNGPYILTVWHYKDDMRLERNPFYWNPGKVKSDSVLCLSIEDPNTAVLAFETGTINWLSDVGVDYSADMLAQVRKYRQHHAARIRELMGQGSSLDGALAQVEKETPPLEGERDDLQAIPAFGTLFYNFNCQEKLNNGAFNPFYDSRVRRAFAQAIDKQSLVENVTRLNQPVANALIPPDSIAGFHGVEGPGFDAQAARRELHDAGWIDRKGDGNFEDAQGRVFPIVEILFPSTPENKAIAQAIAGMWEKNLGVKTRLRAEETKVAAAHLKAHDFMVARGNWYGDYGDPTTFLDLNRTGNGNNDRNYSNPAFDALMEQSDHEADPEKRMRILEKADAIITQQDIPLIPLYNQVTLYMYDPAELAGVSRHPRLTQFLWQMEVTRR